MAAARGRGGGGPQMPYPVDLRLNGARVKRFDVPGGTPEVRQLIIGGPYNAIRPRHDASRSKIFTCNPKSEKEEAALRAARFSHARRAARSGVRSRTPTSSRCSRFTRRGGPARDFDSRIQRALEALLVSPDFLFRIEQDPAKYTPGKAYPVSDVELASRLSFFLWSSIPDDQLLDLAERGTPEECHRAAAASAAHAGRPEVRRARLRTSRGSGCILRNVETATPDPVIFPFDEALRAAFMKETELFVGSIVREDRSLLDLLTADHTFVNERLAEHYGIPKVYGSQFRRVTLTDPNRRGLLGKGSILTVTAYPNRTSVVLRGKWVLENLLGTPPPPPPADVPELVAKAKDGKALSLREQMEQHRSNAVCAACHARMDPIGFALENYDGVGKWRDEDAGIRIDASGKLPDGSEFSGPAGLTQLMVTKYREDFVRTVTEKLMTYALGRGVEYYDNPTVRAIARQAAADNYRLSSLIISIVKSTPFQMRRASES